MNEANPERQDVILDLIHQAAQSRQAGRPVALDLQGLTPFTDYFYICTSSSRPQSKAIVDAVSEALDRAGFKDYHVEGLESSDWILIDAGDVIAHVFLTDERREFFSLERLWADAEPVPLPTDEPSPEEADDEGASPTQAGDDEAARDRSEG